MENTDQCQEFPDETRGPRQADIGHGKEHEDQRIGRHPVHQTAISVNLAGVHPVIDHAHAEKERTRDKAMAQHLENRTIHALLIGCENPHGHITHMRHRRISDQLFHIRLRQSHQRSIDNRNGAHPQHQRRQHLCPHREHRQAEAQEAIAAHLQEDRRQHDRTCGRRLHVGVGQPCMHRPHRHLDRKAGKECKEHQRLHTADHMHPEDREGLAFELMFQQCRNIRGASIRKHRHHRHQHQHRAEEGVEEELERRINAFLAAPDADDQEHRDKPRLEEEVEEHKIERHEHAQHQRFQQEERDHVFFDARGHAPRGRNRERHHESGQHHEKNADPVHPHLVFQPQEPLAVLDELKSGVRGIELEQDKQGHDKGQRRRDQRHPFGIALRRLIRTAQKDRKDCRRDRRDEGHNGKQVVH